MNGYISKEMYAKGHKHSVIRRITSEDLMYNIVALVNNMVLYT